MDTLIKLHRRNPFTLYIYTKSLQCTNCMSYNFICQLYIKKAKKEKKGS